MKTSQQKKPNKKTDDEIFALVEELISKGEYIFSTHAKQRLQDRNISDLEVLNILEGTKYCKRKRNKSKDAYEVHHQDWSYCIEGTNIDQSKIRVLFSFNDELMLIITVIRLD